jgi:anti-sigma factor RsiW
MKCGRARNMWMLTADVKLRWWNSARLSRHLSACGDCREFVAAFRSIDGALAGLTAPEPSASLAAAVHLEAVRALEPARTAARAGHRRLGAGRLAFGTAGAGIAALALFLVFSAGPSGETTLEQDLAQAETGMARLYEPVATSAPKGAAAIDDQMQSIEGEIRCLEMEMENPTWNSLEGGNECTES